MTATLALDRGIFTVFDNFSQVTLQYSAKQRGNIYTCNALCIPFNL